MKTISGHDDFVARVRQFAGLSQALVEYIDAAIDTMEEAKKPPEHTGLMTIAVVNLMRTFDIQELKLSREFLESFNWDVSRMKVSQKKDGSIYISIPKAITYGEKAGRNV